MAKITIEELSESLKNYLDSLGLTEAQIQELINSNLIDIKNTLNKSQKHKLTNDDGTSIFIDTGSFNDIITPGNYAIGSNVIDKPLMDKGDGSDYNGWYHLVVVGSNENWLMQTATVFEIEGHGFRQFVRGKQNGTWTPWRENSLGSYSGNVIDHNHLTLSGAASAPNYFINPFFSIDQEKSNGTRNDFQTYRRQYIADGWLVNTLQESYADKLFVTKLENRIITWATPGFELGQFILRDDLYALAGKRVTLSFAIDTEQTVKIAMSHYNDNIRQYKEFVVSGRHKIISYTFTMPLFYDMNFERSYFCFEILESTNPEGWFDVYYGKLEISDYPTVCNNRPYAEELLNCRRYYEKRYTDTYRAYYNGNKSIFILPHSINKYKEPTYNLNGLIFQSTNGASQSGTISNVYCYTDHITIEVNGSVDCIKGDYIIDARPW
jgi:hypothetical protein